MDVEMIRSITVLSGLLINSIYDMKEKQILIKLTVFCAIIGLVSRVLSEFNAIDFFLASVPGAASFLLAFLSKEKVGYGDAWVLLAMGCCINSTELFEICLLALVGIGLVALFLLSFFHKKGSFEIPFVPFLLAATVCVRCMGL